MRFSVEQINVGDQLAFEDSPQKSNRDLFWKVVDKSGSKLIVELKKYIWDESWTIEVKDVKWILKMS